MGGGSAGGRTYGEGVLPNRALAGLLALSTIALAVAGEALVLTHTLGALGLILLPAGAAAGVAGWVALGAPSTRAGIARGDIRRDARFRADTLKRGRCAR